MSQGVARPDLVRGLGLAGAVAINVANMIGTGVFLKSRVMACNVGHGITVLAVWFGAGLLVLCGTFCYAEIAAMFPEAGGEYVFLKQAYGRFVGFLGGWTSLFVMKPAGNAAIAVGFAIFLNVALSGGLDTFRIGGANLHVDGLTLVALAAMWTTTLINCSSISAAGTASLAITILKTALLALLALGAFTLARGDLSHLVQATHAGRCEGVPSSAQGGLAGLGAAMLGALWAYDGWNNVTPLAGEIRDPARNLPRAFTGGVLVVGGLYLAANLSYFYVLTPTEIANVSANSSVATVVAERFLGHAAVTFIAISLVISSFGALNAGTLAGPRTPFAMARDGVFFRALAEVSRRTRVPVRATIAQTAWASILVISGSYDSLSDAAMFASWLFFGLAAGSLFVFRRRFPHAPRPYRALGYPWLPATFVGIAFLLTVNTFVASPKLALAGLLMLLVSVPFYLYWTRYSRPPGPIPGEHSLSVDSMRDGS
jgi:basic amino acid/polyamine antiporter, APA family